MYLRLHAQLGQSEDDIFDESLMQVDEPVDHLANPSTPLSPTPPPKQPRLGIPDQAIEQACKHLARTVHSDDDDAEILVHLVTVWFLVHEALSQNLTLSRRLANLDEFRANVRRKGEQQIIVLLRNMARKKSWQNLLENEVFLKKIQADTEESRQVFISDPSINATVQAWSSPFRGNAADVLLVTISDYLNKQRVVYARHTSIVNSSGTGKSRIVDEVARKILTVPMCLREDGSQGFPPPDEALRGWLTSTTNPNDQFAVAQKLHGFVYSLLAVTHKYLVTIESERHDIPTLPTLTDDDIDNLSQAERSEQARLVKVRQGKLAGAFHECMTAGQSFQSPNSYRQTFFEEVIDRATEFTRDTVRVLGLREQSLPGYQHRGERVTKAGIKLSRFVDPKGLLDSAEGPRHPLVILAFDESHTLTDTPRGKSWTVFSELHWVLGQLVDLPIFSLFLSTAGKFHLFSPEIRSDPSRRVANRDLPPLHPVSEISFDDLAYPAIEDNITLSRVVQMDWIAHLGRPLFGSHFDALPKNRSKGEIMLFAKQKLLDGKSSLADVNGPGTLACLSVRFALEFNIANGDARIVARRQIERHMRLCVAATTGFETLVTVAGSEPLLAEAACQLMSGTEANPVRHLVNNSDLNCVDLGQRGELVAALLVMRARDESSVINKWVYVIDFMKALLPAPAYEILKDARPSHWRPGESKPFEETFSGCAMWFNHVIRIRDSDMINIRSLWKFITRGAMVMCANKQRGIDIVLPICNTSRKLSRNNVTAILIQVKNDKTFQHQIDKMLFDGMDPFRIGLCLMGTSRCRSSEWSLPSPLINPAFSFPRCLSAETTMDDSLRTISDVRGCHRKHLRTSVAI